MDLSGAETSLTFSNVFLGQVRRFQVRPEPCTVAGANATSLVALVPGDQSEGLCSPQTVNRALYLLLLPMLNPIYYRELHRLLMNLPELNLQLGER